MWESMTWDSRIADLKRQKLTRKVAPYAVHNSRRAAASISRLNWRSSWSLNSSAAPIDPLIAVYITVNW